MDTAISVNRLRAMSQPIFRTPGQPEIGPLILSLRHVESAAAIHALRTYLEVADSHLLGARSRELEALCARFPRGGLGQEDHGQYVEERYEIESLFDHDLRPSTRYPVIVLSQSLLESRLNAICEFALRKANIPVQEIISKPFDIRMAAVCLRKTTEIELAHWPGWAEMLRFQAVRDCIVDSLGYVDSRSNHPIRVWAKECTAFSISSSHRFLPKMQFCQRQLALVKLFFDRLLPEESFLYQSK